MIIVFFFFNIPATASWFLSISANQKVAQFVSLQMSIILQRVAEGLLLFSPGQWWQESYGVM